MHLGTKSQQTNHKGPRKKDFYEIHIKFIKKNNLKVLRRQAPHYKSLKSQCVKFTSIVAYLHSPETSK